MGDEDLVFTGYIPYDDIHEENYQRVYSEADFRTYPRNVIPIQSFRNTEHEKQRSGVTLDGSWELAETNLFLTATYRVQTSRLRLVV